MPADPTPERTLTDRVLDAVIAVGVTLLILIGFVASYRTLRDLAATVGGYPPWLAPAVPLSFDLGIVTLSLKVIQQARRGGSAALQRVLIVALSGASVLANAASAANAPARLLHVVPPAMFIVTFESLAAEIRRSTLAKRPARPRRTMAMVRWALAPSASWAQWRQSALAPDSGMYLRMHSRPLSEPRPTRETTIALIRDAVNDDPSTSSADLRDLLARHGHALSLRSVQRLRRSASPVDVRKGVSLRP